MLRGCGNKCSLMSGNSVVKVAGIVCSDFLVINDTFVY